MNNCNTGTNVPILETELCNGEYIEDNCVIHPESLVYLNLPINSSVNTIISKLILSLTAKDQQISNQTTIIEELQEQLIPPYKIHTALLNQTGTNAPVATVLENTLGGDIVWTYVSSGVYQATLNDAFTLNKVFIIKSSGENNNAGNVIITNLDVNGFRIQTLTGDSRLVNFTIEIKVYL